MLMEKKRQRDHKVKLMQLIQKSKEDEACPFRPNTGRHESGNPASKALSKRSASSSTINFNDYSICRQFKNDPLPKDAEK